ncbi:MAG: hypothetical protein ACRYE9_01260 [Janthinobacterium lividum]
MKDSSYNKLVDLSKFYLKISHEKLYRNDDLIIVVGYNDNPIIAGKGSAILSILHERITVVHLDV